MTKKEFKELGYRITWRKSDGIKQPVIWKLHTYRNDERKWKICKPTINRSGYKVIHIQDKQYYIHHLVLIWKVFPKGLPEDGLECDHINRIKTDNNFKNLRWVTHSVNCYNRTNKNSRTVIMDGSIEFPSIAAAAKYIRGNYCCVSDCLAKRQLSHKGHTFKFKED